MPFNLLKKYNSLLDLNSFTPAQREESLKGIFKRDFIDTPDLKFLQKDITPVPSDGEIKMDTLFKHLTSVIENKSLRNRIYDHSRSIRLHWVRFHLNQSKIENMLVFSVQEPEGPRTYIYDKDENYVIVLEPLRNGREYYLLTAYYLNGKDSKRDKIMAKYRKRRLNTIL